MQLDLVTLRDRRGWCYTCPHCSQAVRSRDHQIAEHTDRRKWHLTCWVAAGRGTPAQVAMVERGLW